jgi:AcrR family transcriptional regulator
MIKRLTGTGRATAEALLDAAEELFARQGLRPTTVRQITRRAGANLAAVHYHFGSKEALVRAALARRFREINEPRLRLLDAAEARAQSGPAALEDVLYAFFAPASSLCSARPDFMKFAGRVLVEADDKLKAFQLSEFREVIDRFIAALARALPGLPAPELFWRFHLIVGAMVFTWTHYRDVPRFTKGLCRLPEPDEHTARLVAMAEATLRAPVPSRLKGGSS